MRDPQRIEKILNYIRTIWEKNPDLRLGQLIGNLVGDCGPTLYYMEDNELVKALESMYQVKTSEIDDFLASNDSNELYNDQRYLDLDFSLDEEAVRTLFDINEEDKKEES